MKVGFVEAVFFLDFLRFMSFTAAKEPDVIDFPEKQAPTKVKYLQPIGQILLISPHEMRENSLSC